MNDRSAVSSRLALQRFFARTDFVPSKTSISRRSRPGSATPFKDSRPDTLVFMLSTLSTNGRHLNSRTETGKSRSAEGEKRKRARCIVPLQGWWAYRVQTDFPIFQREFL